MPTDFVLELRNVSSLTEARFAAGEGFTHIRLSPDLASQGDAIILGIKEFLSGLAVGLELPAGTQLPAWADYAVRGDALQSEQINLPLADAHQANAQSICILDNVSQATAEKLPPAAGLSIPSPAEYKTGFADFEPLQDLLEIVRAHYGL